MATLNLWVVEEEGSTGQSIHEALSILRWAADTGPFSLGVERIAIGPSTTEDFNRLAQRTTRADATFVDPKVLARAEFAQTLRQAIGVEAHLRSLKLDPAWIETSPLQPEIASCVDLTLLRADRHDAGANRFDLFDAPLPTLQRFAKTAIEIAGRRTGRVTRLRSNPQTMDDSLWTRVLHDTARQSGIEIDTCPTERFTARLLTQPQAFDVVVAEDRFGALITEQAVALAGPHELAPSTWIGRRGNLYEPGSEPSDPIADVCASILTMTMLLELSASRFGLATTVRRSLGRVLGELEQRRHTGADSLSAWQVGQAVLEQLEAGFRLCASF
jgi:3-isopropylmalate dehydrogenase